MNEYSLNNKKIAKNAIMLYIKLVINIAVSFVVSRLVLDALGASDYGLYNVVGGIVTLLNTMGTSMVATSYRYMAVEFGKADYGNVNKIYNTIFIIHLVFAFILLIFGETFGVFYIENYLNVDPAKLSDALFILHFSLLTTFFAVITVPMNGLIIAKERFLFTSIVDSLSAILKLVFVIFLIYMDGNRLRFYVVSLAIVQLISPIAYQVYCALKNADVIKWNFNKDFDDYKRVLGFAWWMFFGTMAVMGKIQGVAIILNFFFGTVINAAFGLASQVSNAVSQSTAILRQATIPQIMKSQSAGDENRSLRLVYATSRYSYLCMTLIALPLLLCMDCVLRIWLGNPPQYTLIFVDFMLINGMISNLSAGFDASIQATGKVRKNQIGYSLVNLALLPIVFILYKVGFPPYINVVVMAVLTIITLVFQIYIMTELTAFKVKEYFKITVVPSLLSTILILLPLVPLRLLFIHKSFDTFVYIVIAVVWTCFSIYFWGILQSEKLIIRNKVIYTIKNILKK